MESATDDNSKDPLHPLATLHWKKIITWPIDIRPLYCAVLRDTVVLLDIYHTLHIFGTDSLTTNFSKSAPSSGSSLTTYKSKFVLVGGYHPPNFKATNQLWTSTTGLDWEMSLPAMPTSRYSSSSVSGGSPEILVVAGGISSDRTWLNVVEVLLGDQWTTVDNLPTPCIDMRSTFHEGRFYFTGGNQKWNLIYTCKYESMNASASSNAHPQPVWSETFVNISGGLIGAIVSFLSRVTVIHNHSIISYSNAMESWTEITSVGDVPRDALPLPKLASSVLSSGQLLVANCSGIFTGVLSDRDEDIPQVMDCMDNAHNPHPVKMSDCHKQWFGQTHMIVLSNTQEQQACTDEDKPTLPSLMVFKCTGRRNKNILNEIGANYYDFGIILLNDENGKEIESLVHKYGKDPKPILRDIFRLWLEGQGQPVSWQTLVSVLENIGLIDLAKTIKTEKL